MASIKAVLRRFTKQKLVYWRKIGSNDFGRPVYAEPVELDCRWEDKQQEVVMPDGRKIMSRGYVLIGDPLLAGSLVFLGTLVDWQQSEGYPAPPGVVQGGREVLLLKQTPDIKARDSIYEAIF